MRTLIFICLTIFLAGCAVSPDYQKLAAQSSAVEVDTDNNNAIDVSYGGTNAITAAGARSNLDVYSTSETDAADDSGTDNQTIDSLSLGGTTLSISLEDDGEAAQTVDLAGLQDGVGYDSVDDIPHATPSNGDTTHFSNADEIYDWVIAFGYSVFTWDYDGDDITDDTIDDDALDFGTGADQISAVDIPIEDSDEKTDAGNVEDAFIDVFGILASLQPALTKESGIKWSTTTVTTDTQAEDKDGISVDATNGNVSITAPTGAGGLSFVVIDAKGMAETNVISIDRNGSKINGADSDLILDTNGDAVLLVYVDVTTGWKVYRL